VSDVAQADPEGPDTGTLAPTTGIASDGGGTLYATWQDAAGVHLASGAAGSLTEVETSSTDGGSSPAVAAVSSGGPVYLAWYDTVHANLEVGVLGEQEDVIVARPSPSITVSVGPAPSAGCGEDGKIALDIVAKGIAWDTTCLVAPANEPFTINIDNQDAGIPHNLDRLTEQGGDSIAKTEVENGPVQQTLDVDPLEVGEYFFLCDVHPNMAGTLVAIDTGKGNK
jgi:plastocyanin